MKYTRSFSKKVKSGTLIYNSRPYLPIPVKVKGLIIKADMPDIDKDFPFILSDLGGKLLEGTVTNNKPISFAIPLRVGIGKHEFRIDIRELPEEMPELKGEITIDYSLFF